ncbi:hypothetical protein [Pseudarthrobacter sp. H2]|uniref:hypothetical protein n=1 Tax=Pseudarthrobacter sp. H2 TaxID=3418415 RepID=UPI003CEAD717
MSSSVTTENIEMEVRGAMQKVLDQAMWTTPPLRSGTDGNNFVVEAAGSDLWQERHYGFSRDSADVLLFPAAKKGSLGRVQGFVRPTL